MNICTGKIVLFLINRQSDTSRRTSTSAVFYVQYRLYLCYNMILLFVRWCYMYQWKKLFRYATQWKNYMEDWISAQERFCYLWSIVTAIAKPVSVPFLNLQYRLYYCYYSTLPFVRWCIINQWKKLFRRDEKQYMEDWISA